MTTQTTQPFKINEGDTAVVTAVVKDSDGNAIAAADLDSLTLTLFNESDESIITSRDNQDVLNTNGVTVDSNGNLEWTMEAADVTADPMTLGDNQIVGEVDDGGYEKHTAWFRWTWGTSGELAGSAKIRLRVLARIHFPEEI